MKNEINLSKNQIATFSQLQELKTYIDSNNTEEFRKKYMQYPIAQNTRNKLFNKSFILYVMGNPNQLEIIDIMLQNGANTDLIIKGSNFSNPIEKEFNRQYPNMCPLELCMKTDDLVMLKKLLDNNALKSYPKDSNLLFYFEYAKRKTFENIKIEIVKNLMRHSRDFYHYFNMQQSSTGYTPLSLAIMNSFFELAKFYLNSGANCNSLNYKNGNSIMHYAVINGDKNFIEFLLNDKNKFSFNLDLKNNKGETALDLASRISTQTDLYAMLAEKYSQYKENIKNDTNSYLFNDCVISDPKKYLSKIEVNFSFDKNYNNSYEEEVKNSQNDSNEEEIIQSENTNGTSIDSVLSKYLI